MIDSRFLLTSRLENPTRMSLDAIAEYWKDWVFRASESDLFSFLTITGITGESNQGQSDGDGDVQAEGVAIDDRMLPPLLCGKSPTQRTKYLYSLVPGRDDNSKVFRTAANLVNALEVS